MDSNIRTVWTLECAWRVFFVRKVSKFRFFLQENEDFVLKLKYF